MTEIRFYQLMQKRLGQALPEIAAKALERDYRIVVKCPDAEAVAALDAALWTYDPGSFLPHGAAKNGMEAQQPIWLTATDENPNGATMLVLTDGAECAALSNYVLCCEIFDGTDDAAVTAARARWKSYKEQGHDLAYFQQDDNGKWQKNA